MKILAINYTSLALQLAGGSHSRKFPKVLGSGIICPSIMMTADFSRAATRGLTVRPPVKILRVLLKDTRQRFFSEAGVERRSVIPATT